MHIFWEKWKGISWLSIYLLLYYSELPSSLTSETKLGSHGGARSSTRFSYHLCRTTSNPRFYSACWWRACVILSNWSMHGKCREVKLIITWRISNEIPLYIEVGVRNEIFLISLCICPYFRVRAAYTSSDCRQHYIETRQWLHIRVVVNCHIRDDSGRARFERGLRNWQVSWVSWCRRVTSPTTLRFFTIGVRVRVPVHIK
jgi:hypothetical protein